MLVDEAMEALTPAVLPTVAVAVVLHPFASEIVQVYDPAASEEAVAAVPPDGAHAYVYEGVPPLADTVADPLLPPHAAGVEETDAVIAEGSVMLNVPVAEHPLASVIVQVYDPAERPLAVAVVPPAGAHAYV
jgi:hypothetical protein